MISRPFACWALRGMRRLRREQGGAVLVEFALVAPMLIVMIMAILHTCLIFFAQQALETAAESVSRMVMTGQAQTTITGNVTINGRIYTPAQQFLMRACDALPPVMSGGSSLLSKPLLANGSANTNNCPRLFVNTSSSTTFAAAATAAPAFTTDASGNVTSSFTYTPGTANAASQSSGSLSSGSTQIVAVKLMYLWPTFSGLFGLRLANQVGGNRLLTASTVMVTESYQ